MTISLREACATLVVAGLGMCLTACGGGSAMGAGTVVTPPPPPPPPAATNFHWTTSAPLISPPTDWAQKIYGVKDPSVVYSGGKYHVFMTTAGEGGWGVAYTSFKDWSDAPAAKIVPLDKSPMGPGYRAAPEVFYFAPQKLWYLIYQGGDPLYSTSADISDPLSWTAPKPFFSAAPDAMKHPDGSLTWLDFWIICDDAKCYLFNSDDSGQFFRSETAIDQFPAGMHNTVRVMSGPKEDIFEASNTYRIKGSPTYITLIEAIGARGRYFRIWKSSSLDGVWEPFSSDAMNTFAGAGNVDAIWSDGISHGEMIRSGSDQTLTIDPCTPLQFLFQGNDPTVKVDDYIKIPYRLGLLTAKGDTPVSALCVKP